MIDHMLATHSCLALLFVLAMVASFDAATLIPMNLLVGCNDDAKYRRVPRLACWSSESTEVSGEQWRLRLQRQVEQIME